MTSLPTNWIEAKLAELSRLVSGAGFPIKFQNQKGLEFPFFKVGNLKEVDSGEAMVESEHSVSKQVAKQLEAKVIPPNAIVFAKIGMAIALNRRRLIGRPSCIDNNMMASIPTDAILPHLLLRFLETIDFMQFSQATTVPSLRKGDIENISVPLPPLPEQRRIVAKLEKLLDKVNASQKRLERIPQILKRFRQSVLAAACSGKLTEDWREENPNVEPAIAVLGRIAKDREKLKFRKSKKVSEQDILEVSFEIPSTWALSLFDDIAAAKPHAIKAGPFGSSLTKACYVSKGFKVYGQEQVINGDPTFGDYYVSKEKFRELQSCEVSAGDILVSLVGTIGRVLIIPKQFQPGIINPRLAKFSLHHCIVREYIANYLLSPLAINMLSGQSHGGTMEILNLGILRALPIPLAPVAEQQEIVRRVEALFVLADQIEARYTKARTHVDKLTQSILAKAFRGELVPPACRQAGKTSDTLPPPKEGSYFVYVLECEDGSFYKGYTENLQLRWKQHLAGTAADWTTRHTPTQVFYWEECWSLDHALAREKYLKSGIGREWFHREVVEKPEAWLSASELLERIRAERVNSESQKTDAKKKGLPARKAVRQAKRKLRS